MVHTATRTHVYIYLPDRTENNKLKYRQRKTRSIGKRSKFACERPTESDSSIRDSPAKYLKVLQILKEISEQYAYLLRECTTVPVRGKFGWLAASGT